MRIDGLNIAFGELTVFENFKVEFSDKKVNCVMGPSGCGKTTLLNHISQIFDGGLGGVSYVFQEPRLLPWRTVRQNLIIAMPDSFSKAEKAEIVGKNLNAVGLCKFADYYPGMLSGGMRQRVSLARAFCVPCNLLLMDEPFSGQDIRTRSELHELFLKLWSADKKTVIAATHDFSDVWALADRVIVLTERPAGVQLQTDIVVPQAQRSALADDEEESELRMAVLQAFLQIDKTQSGC